MKDFKLLIAIQARSQSKRFPGKIYQTIGEKTILRWVYDACETAARKIRAAKVHVDCIVLGHSEDTELRKYCLANQLDSLFPKCDENDLLERYLKAATEQNSSHIIRITADCWQTNPELICEVGALLLQNDYVSNTITRSFIEGVDTQGVSYPALKWFDENQTEEREHPFKPFERNESIRIAFEKKFKYIELLNPQNPLTIRTSIDSEDDLKRAREIYEYSQKARPNMGGEKQERPSAGL